MSTATKPKTLPQFEEGFL